MGRKSSLSSHGWISSPKRRETATIGRTRWPHASRTEDAEQPFAQPEYLVGYAPEQTWPLLDATGVVTAHPEPSGLADIADGPDSPFRQVANLVACHLGKIATK